MPNISINGAPTEVSLVLSTPVTLTDAQIKALPTTPFELVPAPGAGKTINFLFAYFILNTSAGGYTNVNTINTNLFFDGTSIGYGSAPDLQSLISAANSVGTMIQDANNFALEDFDTADIINKALQLNVVNGAPAGDFTGGNAANTLKIITCYTIIEV